MRKSKELPQYGKSGFEDRVGSRSSLPKVGIATVTVPVGPVAGGSRVVDVVEVGGAVVAADSSVVASGAVDVVAGAVVAAAWVVAVVVEVEGVSVSPSPQAAKINRSEDKRARYRRIFTVLHFGMALTRTLVAAI
ncbi:MAG: hypothetical protein OXC98_11575 [bacterium]|nr:hypothetical protein [Acidimicrobiia bacterium]MCY4650991.1 hypothetical protein [bacterium]